MSNINICCNMYIIIYIDILKPQILPEGLEGRGDQ